MIRLGTLVPHPPIMVEGIGKPEDLAKVSATISAMNEINQLLAQEPPETLIIFTPHGTVFSDAIVVYGDKELSGDLRNFGLAKTWQWPNDLELVQKIITLGNEAKLPVLELDSTLARRYRPQGALDHGVLVPLSFFDPTWAEKTKLVIIPLSYLPIEDLYRFGSIVQEAANRLNRRVAVIASGDLSHCLKPGAPAGYNPHGEEFDQKMMALIQETAVIEFFQLNPVLLEKAAECGFRSIIMLLGALDQQYFETKVHSYQGPFGVGYGVASFKPTGLNRNSFIHEIFHTRNQVIQERRQNESPLVHYARQVVESYIKNNALPEVVGLDNFTTEKAGVFVSIKKHGQLRGCIGTTEPTQSNIINEVQQNAISASTKDPRFNPVEEDELTDLVYSVDILKPAEPIPSIEQLDPERYGVIVSKGYRRGLLLPNLEGIDTAAEQVAIAKKKAGIPDNETVDLERFEVVRYH